MAFFDVKETEIPLKQAELRIRHLEAITGAKKMQVECCTAYCDLLNSMSSEKDPVLSSLKLFLSDKIERLTPPVFESPFREGGKILSAFELEQYELEIRYLEASNNALEVQIDEWRAYGSLFNRVEPVCGQQKRKFETYLNDTMRLLTSGPHYGPVGLMLHGENVYNSLLQERQERERVEHNQIKLLQQLRLESRKQDQQEQPPQEQAQPPQAQEQERQERERVEHDQTKLLQQLRQEALKQKQQEQQQARAQEQEQRLPEDKAQPEASREESPNDPIDYNVEAAKTYNIRLSPSACRARGRYSFGRVLHYFFKKEFRTSPPEGLCENEDGTLEMRYKYQRRHIGIVRSAFEVWMQTQKIRGQKKLKKLSAMESEKMAQVLNCKRSL